MSYKLYLTKVFGVDTCFKNINKCDQHANCDPTAGSDTAEDELNCDDEYRRKKLVPELAYSETFFCQSPDYNEQSVMANWALGVVWFRAIPNNGKAECWKGKDEKDRSSIWVSFIIPGLDLFT